MLRLVCGKFHSLDAAFLCPLVWSCALLLSTSTFHFSKGEKNWINDLRFEWNVRSYTHINRTALCMHKFRHESLRARSREGFQSRKNRKIHIISVHFFFVRMIIKGQRSSYLFSIINKQMKKKTREKKWRSKEKKKSTPHQKTNEQNANCQWDV